MYPLHVVGQVVFFGSMDFKSMRHFIKILLTDSTNEAFGLEKSDAKQDEDILCIEVT